jgi:hypothetical protein
MMFPLHAGKVYQMRTTRKINRAGAAPEHTEEDSASTPSIVRLGTIAELVEGMAIPDLRDSQNSDYYSS